MTAQYPGLPRDQQGDCVFPLLANPSRYVACQWDLRDDPAQRAYWCGLIGDHFPAMLEDAVRERVDFGVPLDQARAGVPVAQNDFDEFIANAKADPLRFETLDIIQLCLGRERALRLGGFPDPFRVVKRRENQTAMETMPGLLVELDQADAPTRMTRLIEGVFAGNIFDLGATKTADLFKDGGSVDFHEVRSQLKPRPWLYDDLDRWLARVAAGPVHQCAVVFVDNAGCDIVLGMLPFVRELLRMGTDIILSANRLPALNDIVHHELVALVDQVAQLDPIIGEALTQGSLILVDSGNGLPLIDLTRISRQLAEVVSSRTVDLVVLEGMGRAVESNLNVQLTCDVMNLAMIKDPRVAQSLDGELYDLVMRFRPPDPREI